MADRSQSIGAPRPRDRRPLSTGARGLAERGALGALPRVSSLGRSWSQTFAPPATWRRATLPVCVLLLAPQAAQAAPIEATSASGLLMGLAAGASLLALAAGLAAALGMARHRAAEQRAAQAAAHLRADLQALRALLGIDARGMVLWREGTAPDLFGEAAEFDFQADPGGVSGVPQGISQWLGPEAARTLAGPLALLDAQGQPFTVRGVDAAGTPISVEGRAAAGARVLVVRDAPAERGVSLAQASAQDEALALRALFDAAPVAMWRRGMDGALAAVNAAFARAVQPDTPAGPPLELLDQASRDAALAAHRAGQPYGARVRVVAGGKRRLLDVVEAAGTYGAAGLAIDVTELEAVRAAHAHGVAAHRRTLDKLNTAVVIFGADERLVFQNSAYERLFGLEPSFLDKHPSEGEVLELLRARRKVPEQADFRAWREQLREAYRALEPVEDWWHLPDGQMLRVVVTPNAEGGVTYLFDDMSESMALKSRYNSLISIQGETLDGLAEAVAVFGSDGRLRLYNVAFLQLWSLSAQALGERPHIDAVAAMCRPKHGESGAWARIRNVVTAFDHREGETLRLERADKRVLDGTAQPLPDGGTMVTFRDVTDSVKVERALLERNEALEAADALKNAFVGHVSYHLRTPLNTLIGYAHLLAEGTAGALNPRQSEFLDHVRHSSDSLRALIDDILDLATIDAGAMALDLAEVDVRATLDGAGEAVRDLLDEAGVTLHIEDADAGTFVADGRRVRQILFNLLSNAIAAAPRGSSVSLRAERRPDALAILVRDHGAGVDPEMVEHMFQRFEAGGSGHRGVGLGLSIVRSFMELHGGSVTLSPARGGGTLATCLFPLAARRSEAAE